VAFVQLPGPVEGVLRVALIDAEGVILTPPQRARYTLPVLRGISLEQSPAARKRQVAAAMRFVDEIGELAGRFSEIDVAEPENIKVVGEAGGRVVSLMLGNRNYLPRLRNFLKHFEEIQQRVPNAVAFDLRLDDRITALEGDTRGG
jgi:hypothetical protein